MQPAASYNDAQRPQGPGSQWQAAWVPARSAAGGSSASRPADALAPGGLDPAGLTARDFLRDRMIA